MELILVSENKLKIMLSRQDMEHYELSSEELDYDCTETRRAFWAILDEAKHKTGFDAARERVFIQMYPSREGGCEMYVTKVGVIPALARDSVRGGEMRIARMGIYSFPSVSALVAFCRTMLARGEGGEESSAYAMDDGRAILVMREYRVPSEYADTYMVAPEFDGRSLSKSRLPYIKEHGACLCKTDAVRTLGMLY